MDNRLPLRRVRLRALLAAGLVLTVWLGSPRAGAAAEPPVTAAGGPLRTSWYPDEPELTRQVLEEAGGFAKDFEVPVHGQVYAQPLVSGNTLFVATEDNWIYGIDARSGEVKWSENVGPPWHSADIGCTDLTPNVGVTGTPVIDPSTNTAYFFSKTYVTGEEGEAKWEMHAVDLANGNERPGFPVKIAGAAQNFPNTTFNPTQQLERPALLLMNGVVYAGFGSHCDINPFHGWIVGVSTGGQIKTMWVTTEEEHNGAAIWMGGGGIASDREGQILFTTGNSWSPPKGLGTAPREGHLGDSVVRAQVEPGGTLKPKDFFAPYNSEQLDTEDLDLGSSAPMPLPSPYFGTTAYPHLLVQVGKAGVVYLLNRDSLGGMKQGPEEKNADLGETELANGVWGSLAAWPGDGGYVYVPAAGEVPGNGGLEFLKYGVTGGKPSLSVATRATGMEFGSGSPIVTSNGTTAGSGIVWVSQCAPEAFTCAESKLDAFAAVPGALGPELLWSERIGVSTKFARPDASGGRIYVGTHDGKVIAFGPTHHTLNVVDEPATGGSVRSEEPAGIECGQVCSQVYENGTAVTLTATAAPQFEFAGWSGGGCSGTGPCRLKVYSDATVHASFVPVPVPPPSGSGPGPISPPPPEPSLQLPDTKIKLVNLDRKRRSAAFRFTGTAGTRSFQCRLTGPAGAKRPQARYVACAPHQVFKHLRPGKYKLQVRAVNPAGMDRTPAVLRFRI